MKLLKIHKVISHRRLFTANQNRSDSSCQHSKLENILGYIMKLQPSIWFCVKQTFHSADKTPLQILVMSYVASSSQLWLSTVAPTIQA